MTLDELRDNECFPRTNVKVLTKTLCMLQRLSSEVEFLTTDSPSVKLLQQCQLKANKTLNDYSRDSTRLSIVDVSRSIENLALTIIQLLKRKTRQGTIKGESRVLEFALIPVACHISRSLGLAKRNGRIEHGLVELETIYRQRIAFEEERANVGNVQQYLWQKLQGQKCFTHTFLCSDEDEMLPPLDGQRQLNSTRELLLSPQPLEKVDSINSGKETEKKKDYAWPPLEVTFPPVLPPRLPKPREADTVERPVLSRYDVAIDVDPSFHPTASDLHNLLQQFLTPDTSSVTNVNEAK